MLYGTEAVSLGPVCAVCTLTATEHRNQKWASPGHKKRAFYHRSSELEAAHALGRPRWASRLAVGPEQALCCWPSFPSSRQAQRPASSGGETGTDPLTTEGRSTLGLISRPSCFPTPLSLYPHPRRGGEMIWDPKQVRDDFPESAFGC